MFCVAALLPAMTVLAIADRIATREADDASEQSLRSDAKGFALDVYSRLELASTALATVQPDGVVERDLSIYFDEISRLQKTESRPASGGFDARSEPSLRASPAGVRLAVALAPGGGHRVVLLRDLPSGDAMLSATLKPSFLWGKPDEMGNRIRLCVKAGPQQLFCGGAAERSAADIHTRSAEWQLFLKPKFGTDGWTFVAVGPAPQRPLAYTGLLVPMAIGVLLLALLLSSMQIRRVLVPLDSLLQKIRALGSVPFTVQDVGGKDEFEVLSKTFEGMGAQIGQQMETLHMLAKVDRQILAREPLEGVIDEVLSHLQRHADATLAIVIARGSGAECHVRRRSSRETVVMQLADMLPMSTLGEDGGPASLPLTDIPPGPLRDWFGSCGDGHVLLLPVQHPSSASAPPLCVLLGMAGSTEVAASELVRAVDLGERIAVALAFERHEHRLVRQARLDPLTGLPNRLAAHEALESQIEASDAADTGFATAFLDLDRFKTINDGLGHAFGDALLSEIARRIRVAVDPGTFVARLGGDEFFLILPGVTGQAQAIELVHGLERAFDLPVVVGQREFQQKFSIGVAFYPTDGIDPASLIRAADMAMYEVKKAGGGDSAFFLATMNTAAQGRLRMENELRAAIHERRITLHYQPRVDSRSGRVVGLEALARWIQPDGVVVPPTEFISLAEECGLIDELGEMVIDEACRQLTAWRAMRLHPPRVGVNVSGHQLASGSLVPTLAAALARWNLDPACLEIEVTETWLMRDSESGGNQLQAVRALGLQVAIDDFGTGYSSLAYLASLPSDTLKIDRAFVVELARGDREAAAIVRFIIGIAHDLGKEVVAEGVESMDQVHMLAAWGCHTIQGYVYARPLPVEDVTRLLVAGSVLQPPSPA